MKTLTVPKAAVALLALAAAGLGAPAWSADVITIMKAGAVKSAIDLTSLATGESAGGAEFKKTLESDLERSGWFRMAPRGGGAYTVSGSCRESGGALSASCSVSATGGKILLNRLYTRSANQASALAHQAADDIVMAVKGVKGIASTRIALVGNGTGSKEIYVCDADGRNLVRVTDDRSICLAPSWDASAKNLYYTSFRAQFPYLYSLDLASAPYRPKQFTRFPGLNASPAVSPDGKSIAMSLSKDGNPEIYVMDISSRALKRVTSTRSAAEAGPSWSPDGKHLVFTSDASGRPHLYMAGRNGGDAKRLTFQGSENTSPCWGANGVIVYSSLRQGLYRLCMLDPVNGEAAAVQLTDDANNYEDPSWAPDGRHIVCARSEGRGSAIYVLDSVDRSLIRLFSARGNWFSPSWSPR